ncbi:unnamed protein product [Onchocerca flexuosa]|uniref:PHB domain-containing protein n=1 Tax=Onchocerca flexuosa TaxID=387005 RepID=A0A183HF32_9BILA|nr:unnamed protein product [Onchocerca flexuosa]
MSLRHRGVNTPQFKQSALAFQPQVKLETGICAWILIITAYIVVFLTLPFSACACIKYKLFQVVQEYERVVIFRLGRLMTTKARGPGLFFVLPCIDSYKKVDLRVVSFDVPPQEIL